jgi:hypothetical protein
MRRLKRMRKKKQKGKFAGRPSTWFPTKFLLLLRNAFDNGKIFQHYNSSISYWQQSTLRLCRITGIDDGFDSSRTVLFVVVGQSVRTSSDEFSEHLCDPRF